MTEIILEFIQSTFTINPYLVTAIISVVPLIEVRGAITVGISLGLNPIEAWLLSSISAIIVCPILLIILRPLLGALKRTKIFLRLAEGMENLFLSKAKKITDLKDDSRRPNNTLIKKIVGIYLFVAIPLPMTGVWTGSAISAFLDVKYRYSIIAVALGNFTAGLIITLLNLALGAYAPYILLALTVFVIISLVSLVIKIFVSNKKAAAKSNGNLTKNSDLD